MNLTVLDLMEKDGVTLRSRHAVEHNPFYDVAADVGCCKLFHPAYMHAYWTLLGGRRNDALRILEIGVEQGRSLRLWERCFPRAEIWAVDIDPDCTRYGSSRSRVLTGDQSDPAFLAGVVRAAGGSLDVVVDDGSHVPVDQFASLGCLWGALNPGGWYAVEDFPVAFGHHFLADWSRRLPGLGEQHYYPDACFLRKSVRPPPDPKTKDVSRDALQ